MLPRAPLHLSDVLLGLRGLPLGVSGQQGFAMSEGAVWCEQTSLPGSDETASIDTVSLEPSPDAIASDFDVRRNIEQPVYQIHGVSPSSNVLVLFSRSCVQENAEIGKSAPPRGCGYRDVNHAGIRVQVESFFPQTVAATPQHGVRDD